MSANKPRDFPGGGLARLTPLSELTAGVRMVTVRLKLSALLMGAALFVAGCGVLPESDAGGAPHVDAELGAREVIRDQPYAQRDSGSLKLDLFLPEETGSGPAPLVVYIHGGNWEAGTRNLVPPEGEPPTTEALAAQRLVNNGYAVATVDYRFSRIEPAPAQLEDIAEAVRWLQSAAGEWNVDGQRIALWGGSAGGQLATLAGAVADGSSPIGRLDGIFAVVNWFGPTDLSAEAERDTEVGQRIRGIVARFLGCAPVDCPDKAEAASPVKNLSGDEPPFLIQHGTSDEMVPVEQSLDFASEVRKRGGVAEMHPYAGLGHGFGGGPMRPRIIDTMGAFLDSHLPA